MDISDVGAQLNVSTSTWPMTASSTTNWPMDASSVANWPLNSSSVANWTRCAEKGSGHFGWEDYAVLAAVLVVSTLIGLFYACCGEKQKTANDFLLGGSNMGTFPMAMSLAASFITAVELLGNPSEMYSYGTQYWMSCVSFVIVIPITSYFYLPVFMGLELTSAFEYLEMRFSSLSRTFAAAMYVLQMVLYTSVAVYAPAVALSRVTGLNTYVAVTCVYVVCIFYASQGGMKAVVMTDTFQAAILVGSILLILGIGDSLAGGPSIIWEHNSRSGRLELFNMDPNPTRRNSFWSVIFGGTFYWLTMFCANQATIQKYLSVETIGQARSALWASCLGLIIIFTINFYTGMIMFAEYHSCDPLTNQEISASDQLLPLYVMNTFAAWKGIPGFFVAGIFSASLGTVASALNSLAAVTVKDFIHGVFLVTLPDNKGAKAGKYISIGFGLLSFALVFIVEQMGSVLQIALSFNGMAGGITLGMFSLGMFFPWANKKGVMVGALTATAVVMWIGVGQQISVARGEISYETKPISTENCSCLRNSTESVMLDMSYTTPSIAPTEVFLLYRISYLWFSMIGCVITVLVGLITSLITGVQEPGRLDDSLISPPIRRFLASLPNSVKRMLRLSVETKDIPDPKPSNKTPPPHGLYPTGIVNLALSLDEEDISRQEQDVAVDATRPADTHAGVYRTTATDA